MERVVERCLGHKWRRLTIRTNKETTFGGVDWMLMTSLLLLLPLFVAQGIKGNLSYIHSYIYIHPLVYILCSLILHILLFIACNIWWFLHIWRDNRHSSLKCDFIYIFTYYLTYYSSSSFTSSPLSPVLIILSPSSPVKECKQKSAVTVRLRISRLNGLFDRDEMRSSLRLRGASVRKSGTSAE